MRKAVNHLKKCDPVMAAIIAQHGSCKLNFGPPTFASLTESIVYQQLAGAAAATIFRRFTDLTGLPLTPKGVLPLSDEQMRAAGLSKQKLSYIRDLAERVTDGRVRFDHLHQLSDDEVIAELTQVKGIGQWTAQMFLMFSLQRMDVLPTGDLGIQSAMKKLYRKRKLPKPAEMEKIARKWQPYRTIACWYLWRSVDTKS